MELNELACEEDLLVCNPIREVPLDTTCTFKHILRRGRNVQSYWGMGKKQDNSYLQIYDNFTLIIFFKDDTRCVDKYLLAKRDINNVYRFKKNIMHLSFIML